MSLLPPDTAPVKSWFGLGFGLFCSGLTLVSWLESQSLAHFAGFLGFMCWTYPWSQMTSFSKPLRQFFAAQPMSRLSIVLTYIGLALVLSSVALRFFT